MLIKLSLLIFFIISFESILLKKYAKSEIKNNYWKLCSNTILIPLYPAPLTCQSGATRWWAFDVLTIMCCTSLHVSRGLRKGYREKNSILSSPHYTFDCMYVWTVCVWGVGGAAYLASKVRAMTPAAMEAARDVPDWARLQLCWGPKITCGGVQVF